jgi:hypothetical protein
VLIPNGAYKGQKFKKLVSKRTIATPINTYARVPPITSKKYRIAITAAIKTLRPLSRLPMFFSFVKSLCLLLVIYIKNLIHYEYSAP